MILLNDRTNPSLLDVLAVDPRVTLSATASRLEAEAGDES